MGYRTGLIGTRALRIKVPDGKITRGTTLCLPGRTLHAIILSLLQ